VPLGPVATWVRGAPGVAFRIGRVADLSVMVTAARLRVWAWAELLVGRMCRDACGELARSNSATNKW
jgi:hypothetical protein